MVKAKTINIHGKEYVPVSERVRMAHDELKQLSITTEVLENSEVVVIKATVTTPKGVYTGISSANPMKAIEKTNPYEVAETSAVGRALAFAGYLVEQGISSADEMNKALKSEQVTPSAVTEGTSGSVTGSKCPECFAVGKTHSPKCSIGMGVTGN
jgi:hypothetical protein